MQDSWFRAGSMEHGGRSMELKKIKDKSEKTKVKRQKYQKEPPRQKV
jgi:hypothetical protein